MKISLKISQSIEQSAAKYFDKAKKQKSKLEGATAAIQKTQKNLKKLKAPEIKKEAVDKRKPDWYEKFRWFYSSEGFLVIGGRDATSNEIIIKKHSEKGDIVFHTDMAGSPFFIIKSEGKKPGKHSISQAAIATASYSRAWRLGLASTEVFFVKPEQVSKQAQAGESLPRGAFMIRGKTTYIENAVRLAIGYDGQRTIGGPIDAISTHCNEYAIIEQGIRKSSDIAKEIRKKIGGDLDEIIRFLPAGGAKIASWQKR